MNCVIWRVRTIGVAGQKGTGPQQLNYPFGVAVDHGVDGFLYVGEQGSNRIMVYLK